MRPGRGPGDPSLTGGSGPAQGTRTRDGSVSGGMVRLAVLCLSGLLVGSGCGGEGDQGEPTTAARADETAPSAPPALASVPAETVRGFTGPGGEPFEATLRTPGATSHLHRRFGTRSLPLPLRTSDLALTQYPCTSCHEGATVRPGETGGAHDYIEPLHPRESGTECVTCHVSDSVQRLGLQGGKTVSLDHAYRLCAQCHFSQVDSWAAGAHGKRLVGWRGRRVVMNCADCHDPHSPELGKRVPYPGPRVPRTGGDDR